MVGEDAPDFAGVFELGRSDLEILKRDAPAVKHAENVVVGPDEKLGGIGKRLVVGEPRRAGVPVRAEDGQVADCGKEPPGDGTSVRVSGKKPVFMKQSQSANSLSPVGPARSVLEKIVLEVRPLSHISHLHLIFFCGKSLCKC